MPLLKVGDYLPQYLNNRLEFSAIGLRTWARYLTILTDRSYYVSEVSKNHDYYRLELTENLASEPKFIVKISEVDRLIRERENWKPRFKNFITKIFNFK